jgi:hypothetical protein
MITAEKLNRISYPQPVASYDGVVSADRLRRLASLCGKGGFVVSARTGNTVSTGYAVAVHPECDQRIGGYVSAADLMEYIRRNWTLLVHPSAVLRVRVDRATGHKLLSVCTVVRPNPKHGPDAVRKARELARQLAYVNETGEFIDMTDGRVVRV